MNKMKQYIILMIVALIGLTSCQDFLDETPKGTLIPKTVNDFGMMLDNYDYDNCIGYGQFITLMMTDDVTIPEDKSWKYSSWGINGYTWADYIYSSSEDDDCYNNFYHVIYICNYILNNLADAPDGTKFTREYVEGAARFHRAFAYFSLVNLYAKHYDESSASNAPGVPLILEANPELKVGRASVQEVYNQINQDLTIAKDLLSEETPEYSFRPNKAAVLALLARMTLYQGDYDSCAKYAEMAMAICPEPYDFNNYERDDVNPDFGINGFPFYGWEVQDVICYKGSGYGPNDDQDYNLSNELIELFNKETDLRWNIFVTTYPIFAGEDPDGDSPRTAFTFPNNRGLNIGELYLTGAEAYARLGQIDEALSALNDLAKKRHKSGTYSDVTERDPDKLLHLILDERRRECIQQGIRWFDLKRLNKDPKFRKIITHELDGETYTLSPDDNHYVLPIPLFVINNNDLVEQNPR